MGKTAEEVISDIVALLKKSVTEGSDITGRIYRDDLRPKDSKKEDITVHFITGYRGDVEVGVVALNAYIMPIDRYNDGVLRKDTKRVIAIQRLLTDWLNSPMVISNYLIDSDTILDCEYDPEVKQHYINVRLQFRHYE